MEADDSSYVTAMTHASSLLLNKLEGFRMFIPQLLKGIQKSFERNVASNLSKIKYEQLKTSSLELLSFIPSHLFMMGKIVLSDEHKLLETDDYLYKLVS